jgi:hypothetical protein
MVYAMAGAVRLTHSVASSNLRCLISAETKFSQVCKCEPVYKVGNTVRLQRCDGL